MSLWWDTLCVVDWSQREEVWFEMINKMPRHVLWAMEKERRWGNKGKGLLERYY